MQNFSTAAEATATALDSAGSAAKENSRYMESLEAKTQQLKATFQDLANNVISNELVGAVLDLADGFLKLANTNLGSFVTQVLLLTGVGWGASTLLQVSKLIPTVISQFSNFATVIGAVSSGSASLTTALAGVTTGGTALAGAFASALPVILAVSAAIAGISLIAPSVSEWWKELTGDTGYYTEKIQEASTELEQNKTKLEQLSAIPEPDRTSTIQSEIDKLKERNAELEKEIEYRQQTISENTLEDVREKYKADEMTPTSYLFSGFGIVEQIEDVNDFSEAVERANQIVEENGIVLKDMEGNVVDVTNLLKPLNQEYLSSEDVMRQNIVAFMELNTQIERGKELNADERQRYSDLIVLLQQYRDDLLSAAEGGGELNDVEEYQIQVISNLTDSYNENAASMYDMSYATEDGTVTLDGLTVSLAKATAGEQLQKAQVDALTAAYPNLSFQLDENTGYWTLNTQAIIDSAVAGEQWAIDMIASQKSATEATLEYTKQRIAILLEEMATMRQGMSDTSASLYQMYNSPEYKAAQEEYNKLVGLQNKLNSISIPDLGAGTGGGSVVGSSGGSGSSSGGSSSSSRENEKETDLIKEQSKAFEEQLAILEDRLKLLQESGAPIEDQIELIKQMQDTVHEQAEWYRSQGLDENSEYLRELGIQWWDYANEIKDLQKQMLDDELSLLDDKAWFIEQSLADEKDLNAETIEQYANLQNQRIEIFRQAQEKIHALAEMYRAQGYAEDSEALRNLGKQWWEYQNKILGIQEDVASERKRIEEEAARAAEEAWREALEAQIDALEKQVNVYEKLFSYISKQIDKEIDKLQQKRDEEEKYWDDKIDALQEQNDEIERQIKLEELQEALASAKQQKLLVYKDGKFQYVQNIEAISEAEKNLEAYEREEALRKEVENLEKLKDQALATIDEQIEAWEKYKEEWSSVVEDYQEEQDRLLLEQELGIELEGDLWRERLDNLSEYVEEYKALMQELAAAQAQLNAGFTGGGGGVSGGAGGSSSGGSWVGGGRPGDDDDYYVNRYSDQVREYAREHGLPLDIAELQYESIYGNKGDTWTDVEDPRKDENYTVEHDDGSTTTVIDRPGKPPVVIPSRPDTSRNPDRAGQTVNDNGYDITYDEDGYVVDAKDEDFQAHAKGTLNAPGGLSLVGEQGPELRVLNSGDGIIPTNITKNLMEIGKYGINGLKKAGQTVYNYNFDKLVLPNVTDSNTFIKEIKRFKQYVYQQ